MIQIETLMAVAGALLLVSVFANRISVFLGIPGLLIFIGIGMLAGSDGIVRIQFYDARMTNYIGTVALAFICLPADWIPVGATSARCWPAAACWRRSAWC